MSDRDRLSDKRAKLDADSGVIAGEGREITAVDRDEFRRAVLYEIDETILGRSLSFSNESGQSFILEVANRRLHRVVDTTLTELSGQQFTEQGDALVEFFATLLDDFFTGSDQIWIKSDRLSDSYDPSNVGCAAGIIADVWSLVLYGNRPAEAAGADGSFINSCTELANSWVRFDGTGILASAGDAVQVQRLSALSNHDRTAFDGQMNNTFGDVAYCFVVGDITAKNLCILSVKIGAEAALFTLTPDNLSKIQTLWAKFQ